MTNDLPFREERDSFGPMRIAADRYWGPQTQRSLHFFKIGAETMPLPLIHALALVKQVAASVNEGAGLLKPQATIS